MLFFLGVIVGAVIGIPVGAIGSFWLHRRNREDRMCEMEHEGNYYRK